jgi:aminobutyraldehyde dehydrogenase
MSSFDTYLLVGGTKVSGQGAPLAVRDPATGEVITEVAEAADAQVDSAVAAARAALPAWSTTTPAQRAELLLHVADALLQLAAPLAELDSLNCGKPLLRMQEDEIHHIVDPFRYMAGAIRCLQGPLAGNYVAGHTSFVRRDAVGVVALITPWNYPAMMAAWKLAPALAAGNTVVIKPAEQTPLSTVLLVDAIAKILPAGVVNLVHGRGRSVGARLVSHPDVALVSLTGDVATGVAVAQAASATLKRLHLELGGKAPVLVYDDADIPALVETLKTASFYNAGQDCTAACRVFAAAEVYQDVVAGLQEAAASLVVGAPKDASTELGPLITQAQRDRVAGFVDRASALTWSRVVCGGKALDGPGYFYQPTVIADVRPGDEIVEREVFGPVVSVSRFDDPSRMLTAANSGNYGLAASVWTRDSARALDVSAKLQYGCIWVNQHLVWPTEMPHGGLKMSGVGKEMSLYGLEDYTSVRHIMLKH